MHRVHEITAASDLVRWKVFIHLQAAIMHVLLEASFLAYLIYCNRLKRLQLMLLFDQSLKRALALLSLRHFFKLAVGTPFEIISRGNAFLAAGTLN